MALRAGSCVGPFDTAGMGPGFEAASGRAKPVKTDGDARRASGVLFRRRRHGYFSGLRRERVPPSVPGGASPLVPSPPHARAMVRIAEIEAGSIADELNLEIGSRVVRINGERVRDGIDLTFLLSDTELELETVTPDGGTVTYEIEREPGEAIGIVPAPDTIRECANKCVFCFIDGNPKDARQHPLAARRRLPALLHLRQLRHAHQPGAERAFGGWSTSASRPCT